MACLATSTPPCCVAPGAVIATPPPLPRPTCPSLPPNVLQVVLRFLDPVKRQLVMRVATRKMQMVRAGRVGDQDQG